MTYYEKNFNEMVDDETNNQHIKFLIIEHNEKIDNKIMQNAIKHNKFFLL